MEGESRQKQYSFCQDKQKDIFQVFSRKYAPHSCKKLRVEIHPELFYLFFYALTDRVRFGLRFLFLAVFTADDNGHNYTKH